MSCGRPWKVCWSGFRCWTGLIRSYSLTLWLARLQIKAHLDELEAVLLVLAQNFNPLQILAVEFDPVAYDLLHFAEAHYLVHLMVFVDAAATAEHVVSTGFVQAHHKHPLGLVTCFTAHFIDGSEGLHAARSHHDHCDYKSNCLVK